MNWNNDPHAPAVPLGTETVYSSLEKGAPPPAVRRSGSHDVPPLATPMPTVPHPTLLFDSANAQTVIDKVDARPSIELNMETGSPDKSNKADFNLAEEIQKATQLATPAGGNVAKEELAQILEGFAHVLRDNSKYGSISYAEHVTEVTELKEMLMEAQETIINLLNDRVFDRAKLARLEAEVRLLPDLQSQAHRAMAAAAQSEQVQKELENVRTELDRLRTSYMRAEERAKQNWFSRLFNRS